MIDGHRVKELLAQQAESVCSHLLPSGKRERNEWVCGDIHGGAGKSFRVSLSGSKTGVYADFAGDEKGGNLLDLWMQVKGLEFRAALEEAKQFLGVRDEPLRRVTAQPKPKALVGSMAPEKVRGRLRPVKKEGAVWQWLTKRGLKEKTIRDFQIGEERIEQGDMAGWYVVFPCFGPDGEVKRLKFRNIEEKAKMWVWPKRAEGGRDWLVGIQAVPGDAQDVSITEGEIDAMSLHQVGFPAVSVPFGAKVPGGAGDDPNEEWIRNCYDWLEPYVTVFLAMDMDEPGREAQAHLATRLGRERIRAVDFPRKDSNETLVELGEVALVEAMEAAHNLDPSALRKPSDFREDVWKQYFPASGEEPGHPAPWPLPFRFRPAEVTVWQGFSKHGKTICLTYCLAWWALTCGARTCVASLEIPAKRTIQNIGRQVMGKRRPDSEPEFDKLMEWLDQYFWIFNKVGQVDLDDLLKVFEYAVKKYNVQHFVIDSLMRTTVDEEDNEAQKVFMNRLLEFAVAFDVHVHLVAHSKKPDARHPEEKFWPNKHLVRGSVHITDLAHNTICVWRNKAKEQKADLLETMSDEKEIRKIEVELAATFDAMFVVQAQRGGDGDEPVKQLWFDQHGGWRFRENSFNNDMGSWLEDRQKAEIDEIEQFFDGRV